MALKVKCDGNHAGKNGANLSIWARFLLGVALVCFGAFLMVYGLAISKAFCSYSRSFTEVAPCYKFDVHGKNVDVLLVGDSSLLYGVQPSILNSSTKISSYNYGMQGPAFSFDPRAVIDRYLIKNGMPRSVVVYFSPWNRMVRHELNDPQFFPLAIMTLRHQIWTDFLYLLLARPSAVVEIPQILLNTISLSSLPATNWRKQMENDDGYFNYASTLSAQQMALGDDCRAKEQRLGPYAVDNRKTLEELRSRYTALGLSLYIYVAPTALCDGHIDHVRSVYRGVADNDPVALPNKYFADDNPLGRHSHVNAEGTQIVSVLLANFLSQQNIGARN